VFEYSKDGKVKITEKANGKEESYGGIYKIEGDKLQVTLKLPDGDEEKDPITIKKISEKELVVEAKNGRTAEFKRLK
jgi:uncharacterized protein (TIGR03066 family)